MIIEYIITKEKSEICSDSSAFLKLLETNSKLSINDDKIQYKGNKAQFELSCEDSEDGKEIVFHLIIKSEIEEEKDLDNLNNIARGIRKTVKESGHPFHINTIWDETSQYYCEKSYPLINTVENLMRKLIFQFMLKTIGSKWIKEALPPRLRQKLTEKAKMNDAEDLLKDSLYHADFIQLIELLFKRYTKVQSVNELFKKLEEIEEVEWIEVLKELKPQSNWERYFSELIEFENLNETWSTLYGYRNLVAHNKLLYKDDFHKIKKLTEIVESKLVEALEKLNEIEIPEEEKEDISSFTAESMEGNAFLSDKINNILIDADEPVTASALLSPRCQNCGKEIDPTTDILIGGRCSDCGPALVKSKGLDRKCKRCGKTIDDAVILGQDSELCSSCRIMGSELISLD